ncbi:acyl-CoA desaturase-like [Zootermopsis nevadensis]|uniref:acyl-CoA desaturase-like n=1 Tax=Zootermopsis nevadensis TaxID=136037 RepID=UPI000B8E92FC|nr:acyl-CoA desaturase-like [Zootermopsis nevadensis]
MDRISLQKPVKPNEEVKIKIKQQIVWKNALGLLLMHLIGLYGLHVSITFAKLLTWIYGFIVFIICGAGITIGAHRCFAHRSFKATFGLRCLLVAFFTMTGENSLYIWVRDHRQHHKYSDTDADPHNAKRGFFFSHCGWLMVRKHPEVIAKGKTLDLSDLEADPIIMFQKKYYYLLYGAINTFIVALPYLLWGESVRVSILGVFILRSVVVYNITWLVNSAAHLYGTRPYNGEIQPVESSTVSILTCGEGWHNFHHTFPSDYRASEYGHKHDLSSRVIQLMEKRGWAYNLKETPQHLVNKWVKKFGDGSHMLSCEWKEDSSDDAETQLSTKKVLNCREEIIRSDMRAYNNVVKATNENIAARRLNTSNT